MYTEPYCSDTTCTHPHLVVANVNMDLSDSSNTRQDGYNAVEDDNCKICRPCPPPVRFPHAQPHNDRKDEVHRDEPYSSHQGHKVPKEGYESCQEGDDDVVDQGDEEACREVLGTEARLVYITELHLEELIRGSAVHLHAQRW